MRVLIADDNYLYLDQVTSELEYHLTKRYSVKHPSAQFIDKSKTGWDGWYRKYDKRYQRLARPFLLDLIRLCKEKDIPIEVLDNRSDPKYKLQKEKISKKLLEGITLEDYQLNALKVLEHHETGIFKLTTGAGKTELAAAITKLYNCPTVIIADIRVVIKQIKERLDLRNVEVNGKGTGLFYGGSLPNGESVIIGSIQSLQTPPSSYKKKNPEAYKSRLKNARKFQEIVKNAELLIVDECDKSASKYYGTLFKLFTGRYCYGFSATPFDDLKPVENLIVRERMGDIIYEVGRQTIQDTGRIIPIKFFMFAVGDDKDKYDRRTFDIAEREEIVENEKFHKFVNAIVKKYLPERTLILIDTTSITDLGLALQDKIENSKFIYGKTSKVARDKALKAFEAGELKCLIGSKILKRGLDLKGGAENVILIGGGKLTSNFDQKIGRAVRKNEKGWSRVFSFYFQNNHYLLKHSRMQLKAITQMGYESVVVFNDCKLDASRFIKARFRKTKSAQI